MKTSMRIILSIAFAVAAIAAFIANRPDPGTSPSEIEIMRSFDANTAESAPQQTVVNGWESNDLLRYIAEQQDSYESQQSALLLVIALGGVTFLAVRKGTSPTSAPSPAIAPSSSATLPTSEVPSRTFTPPSSEAPTGSAPADWYADPKGEARLRYWNGSDWTEQTS